MFSQRVFLSFVEAGGGFIGLLGSGILGGVIIGTFLPALAVSVRRLHDSNKTGWWFLLNLVSIGSIIFLVFMCLRGTTGPNRFGEDPYGGVSLDVFD
ncbi:MAG: DUF805 domain-containing protein [Pikeienuella sp.]